MEIKFKKGYWGALVTLMMLVYYISGQNRIAIIAFGLLFILLLLKDTIHIARKCYRYIVNDYLVAEVTNAHFIDEKLDYQPAICEVELLVTLKNGEQQTIKISNSVYKKPKIGEKVKLLPLGPYVERSEITSLTITIWGMVGCLFYTTVMVLIFSGMVLGLPVF